MTRDALNFEQLLAAIAQAHGALAEQASRAVNVSLTLRNWCIGFHLAEFEQNGADRAQYGARLMEEVSSRLKRLAIPGVASRSLRQCRQFYQTYPQIGRAVAALDRPGLLPSRIWQTPSAKFDRAAAQDMAKPESGTIDVPAHRLLTELSFSHFAELLQIEDPEQRTFYEVECLRGHWSVRELKRQINTLYFERSGLSTAPAVLHEQVQAGAERSSPQQIIRDPYVFEFLDLKPQEVMTEGSLEEALLDKLQAFLLELGHGFCFEARQKRLLIGGEHFFVDLVFYHRVLKCHVLIELKSDAFRHEHLGQLNSYVAYYQQNESSEGDHPPVGLLLCTHKNEELVEYALAGLSQPLFVSRYQVHLPDKAAMANFVHQAVQELRDSA